MGVTKSDLQYLITFGEDGILGEVNASLERALSSMAEQHHSLDLEVFAPVRAIRETISRAVKEKDAIVRVISIYGPKCIAQSVGRELSQQKIYLQHPDHIKDGAEYDNPHVLKLSSNDHQLSETDISTEEKPCDMDSHGVLKETITEVYASLTRDKNLQGLEGDARLVTTLLNHQKTALDFMSQRESGPIPEKYCLWEPAEVDGQACHRHAVTNTICEIGPPDETGGGILADEPRSSATLIVASSDLMINEWFLELKHHFDPATLSALRKIKYHGQNRMRSLATLCEADIIITTYHTLASEQASSKDIINGVEWFRVVLDEAHIIRRQSTGLYRAVAGIPARSRWCLTGTPVQNRLEDIGTLLAFLRIEPFHSIATFRKFISLPFEEGERRRKLAVQRFTRLLDSMCLRRTKDVLHLPDQRNIIRSITLCAEEREQYDQTRKTMMRAIKHQHGVLDQKSTLGLFQVQLQLRIICNHGTWQQSFSWNRRKLHLLDEREALEASFGREGERTCSGCRQTLPLFGSGATFQQFEECRHVLCSECFEDNIQAEQEERTTRCPLCSSLWHARSSNHQSKHTSQEDMYFRPEGQSSKMNRLMADVMMDIWRTKRYVLYRTVLIAS
ncbi:SNF2 family N-terminal domain-containing protein [Paraphoma chrysanthemicola]|uniref:SNF2 family N-terminal domain-containing protein n=1 Tax=Paraphoma chrysanthemicola TaxID=798071 RepID=A0A8K0R659_9PLEO|nr:SNF2 family N-terminal domain-containing protein [Paraphoma chrysanthemicola]